MTSKVLEQTALILYWVEDLPAPEEFKQQSN
ncbi:hypothetical protein Cha6605_4789 [Chamaesiphon minutus PCC 6605]|uniref:Uncharacterized protein n=1 Tax=Chamaesiphon minutus (strain ATCC 27169 / PCC 6605) TaxID=1173020 RepID=K9UND1_CHAP6|nr:hypothetical protein Cha6605_4789 [Chamaesiphon minutus PCC 6605]